MGFLLKYVADDKFACIDGIGRLVGSKCLDHWQKGQNMMLQRVASVGKGVGRQYRGTTCTVGSIRIAQIVQLENKTLPVFSLTLLCLLLS